MEIIHYLKQQNYLIMMKKTNCIIKIGFNAINVKYNKKLDKKVFIIVDHAILVFAYNAWIKIWNYGTIRIMIE